jgi:REP element-mobilizing transposase RayT
MKDGYQIRDQRRLHFMTFTVVDWVDIFTRKVYRDLILDSFNYCRKEKGMILQSYVIMSNHIHVVMGSKDGKLSDLVRDFKKFTASKILKLIETEPESRRDWMLKRFEFAVKSHTRNEKYQFWKHESHPEEIFSEKFLWTKIEYIHQNPVRAGWVHKEDDYVYSSASNYVTLKGIIEVDLAEVRIFDAVKEFNRGLR